MTVTANSGEVGIKEAEQKRAKEGDQYKKHVTGTEIWLSEEKKKTGTEIFVCGPWRRRGSQCHCLWVLFSCDLPQ